jgi:hypothetical protein
VPHNADFVSVCNPSFNFTRDHVKQQHLQNL